MEPRRPELGGPDFAAQGLDPKGLELGTLDFRWLEPGRMEAEEFELGWLESKAIDNF